MNAFGIAVVAVAVAVLLGGLIDAWHRFRFHKLVKRVTANPANSDPRALEDSKYGTVVADSRGLKIKTSAGESAELPWREIAEVHAFKKDLETTDLICLAFKKCGREEYCEIHEEMAGYYDSLQAAEKYLPGFTLNWILDTAFPAFATNHKVIWKSVLAFPKPLP